MSKYKVEKNIPVPGLRSRTGLSQALRQMKRGDSVLLPKGQRGTSAASCARALGMKIATRTLADGRVRIWKQ